MSKYALIFLSVFPALALFAQQPDPLLAVGDEERQTAWVDSVYNSLSTEEKIGQLFMIQALSSDNKARKQGVENLVKQYHVGGIIFSKGGPVRQAQLTNRLQKAARTPLLIAMDAEWGLSMRLDSTFAFPWNMTMGAVADMEPVQKAGRHIGEHCRRLGVHMNFAPVIDINTNPANPIIGNRSFGEDRDNVTEKAIAFMQGMQSAGVLANGKHFPGHGDTHQDSHKTLPSVDFSQRRLEQTELFPYDKLIGSGLESVMVAHLNVPALEPSGLPTSLSGPVITGILKEQMGFNGLIFTDALNMKGVTDHKRPGEADLAAFLAGNDILLMSEDVPKAHKMLLEALEKGTFTEKRLEHSVKKILKSKYKAGLHTWCEIDTYQLVEELNRPEDEALYETTIENAITVVKNKDGTVPVRELPGKRFAYVHFGDDNGLRFHRQLQKYAPVDWIQADKLDEMVSKLEDYDLVIIGYHKSDRTPWERYKFSQRELTWIYEIARMNKVVLNIFTRPYALLELKSTANFESIIVSYQNNRIAQEVSAQLIFGARGARGKLPVSAGEDFPLHSGHTTPAISRLSYGLPGTVGMSSQRLQKVDSLARLAMSDGMAPGLQLLIARHGKVIFRKNYGHHTWKKDIRVQDHHLYDLASLTKILATTPLIMQLVENKTISLNTTLGELLPEYKDTDKSRLTLKQMLSHYAGFKSWIPFYKETLDSITKHPSKDLYSKARKGDFSVPVTDKLYAHHSLADSIHKTILESELAGRVRYCYSDLPYYLLKKYLENHYKKPLDEVVQEEFYQPLGANHTTFLPTEKFPLSQIAPTEEDKAFRMQRIHGYVHDQGAAMIGGVSGHAGLFSTADDVAKIMQMYLWKGHYGGKRYFKPETIGLFNTCHYCDKSVRRGIGFDKPQVGGGGPTADLVSMSSFGHSGFTGTYTWVDPENGLLYVFLSNRTFPDADNRKLISTGLRTQIQQAIYEAVIQ